MENQTTTTRTALKWGVIVGIISILYSTAIMIFGQIGNQALSYVAYLIIGVGIYLALSDFKKQNSGFISFGQGLGLGTMLSAIVGLISSFYSFVYVKFIDSSIPQQIMKSTERELEKKGLPDDQIEQAMEYSKMFMSPGVIFVVGVFSTLLLGFVISLIIAAITKKNKPVFE